MLKSLKLLVTALALLATVNINLAIADTNAPNVVVENSIEKVMLALEENRDVFEENPDILVNEMISLLEPVVAFDSIANAVMGKHKKTVTKEQKEKFAETFKVTMVRLYAKALLAFESKSIDVMEPLPEDVKPKKAKVLSHVVAEDGTVYKVIYSMRKNKEGKWQARNMIVDGINLGLTYLNQFDSAMNRYENDVNKVIESWSADLDNENQE